VNIKNLNCENSKKLYKSLSQWAFPPGEGEGIYPLHPTGSKAGAFDPLMPM